MFINWLEGIAVLAMFWVWIMFANWGWWKVSSEKLWDDPSSPFAWLLMPIVFPLIVIIAIAIVVLIVVIIPEAIGRAI